MYINNFIFTLFEFESTNRSRNKFVCSGYHISKPKRDFEGDGQIYAVGAIS